MRSRTGNSARSLVLRAAVPLALVAGILGMALPALAEGTGEVRWFDLLTEDAAAANAFYSGLFGWQIERSPSGAWTATRDGRPIAGISQIDDTMPEVESTWLAVIVVEDLRASVRAARRLGATVGKGVTRVKGYGSYAVIEDPQTAPVMLAVTERPLGGTEGPGAWVWAELWTDDLEASSAFYGEVVGYRRSEVERPGGDYPVFLWGEEPRAGLVAIGDQGIEPGWAPYLGVADLAAAVERTTELGGEVLLAPDAGLAGGRVALLEDPTGGAFFVYQLEEDAP